MASQFAKALDLPFQKALVVFYSISGFAGHRDLLKAAIASTGAHEPPQELLDIMTAAEELNTMRNDLVHGNWLEVRGKELCISVAKPKNKARTYILRVTVTDIETATDKIADLTDRLYDTSVIAVPRRSGKHGSKD